MQFAFGAIDPRKVTKPVAGHFAKAGVTPRRHVAELRTEDVSGYTVGQELTASEVFDAGAVVDVTGTSKGKGTAGVMKRHGFKGLGAGHGVQRKHRSPGSIGGCSTPGRVFKGLRMAGRMGDDKVTTQNLTVHAIDADKGLVLILGAVPGPKGGVVLIKSAVKNHARLVPSDDHRPDHQPGRRRPRAASSSPARSSTSTANVPLMHQVVVAQLAAARQGNAQDQDPRRGVRRRQEAVPAEGHRPGPPGLDPRAAVQRRRHRARPACRTATPSGPRRR